MNILDLITAGIVLVCVLICAAKGLLISVYNLFSLFIAFMLTRRLYPIVSDFLRDTPLYGSLRQITLGWIGQNEITSDTGQIVTDTVDGMALPELFRRIVLDNIEPDALDLTAVYDSVSSFAAGLAIDALAMVAVFITVFMLMRVVGMALRVVSRMPVIKTFNRIGGAVMGLVIGAILSWLTLSVMQGLFAANADFPVADLLDESLLARLFMFGL